MKLPLLKWLSAALVGLLLTWLIINPHLIFGALAALFERFPALLSLQQWLLYGTRPWLKSVVAAILFVLLVLLLFFVFWLCRRIVYAVMRALGKDPVENYRAYDRQCREKLGEQGSELQLERPDYRIDRMKKAYNRIEFVMLFLVIFFTVFFRRASAGSLLGGIFLGFLAALGFAVFYLLLWLVAIVLDDPNMRIRRMRK